jgi:hypothetical protein
MIISVCNSYDSDEAEDIIFKISDLLKEIASLLKENSVADYTYDVLIWVQLDQYPSATDIYRTLKSRYNGAGSVKKISISRKLILLSVSDE